ncbi:MAG: NAD-dependent epimerase/dehydratase family protein [Methylibium petroleiphilum]|nr:NAD-dependent epimerase/dehydratase family protein [Methylibium petroleiphilum]
MNKNTRIFVAGHRGMVGSAIVRRLQAAGYTSVLTASREQLDLLDQRAVHAFLAEHRPEYCVVAAAKVGGIAANDRYRADFLYENLLIEANLIHGAHLAGVQRLLFLGSSCIYPRDCPQPIREDTLSDVSCDRNAAAPIICLTGHENARRFETRCVARNENPESPETHAPDASRALRGRLTGSLRRPRRWFGRPTATQRSIDNGG